jgi:hypothetical protein
MVAANGVAPQPACEWPWVASVEFAGRKSDLDECSTDGALVEVAYTASAAISAIVVLHQVANMHSRRRLLRNLPIVLCFGLLGSLSAMRSAFMSSADRPLFAVDPLWTVLYLLSFMLFGVAASVHLSRYLGFIRAQAASMFPLGSTKTIKRLTAYSRAISASLALWIAGCVTPLAVLATGSSTAGERIAYLRACLAAWGFGLSCEWLFIHITTVRAIDELEHSLSILEEADSKNGNDYSEARAQARKLVAGIAVTRSTNALTHGVYVCQLLLGAFFPSLTRYLAYLIPLSAALTCLCVMITNIALRRPPSKARVSVQSAQIVSTTMSRPVRAVAHQASVLHPGPRSSLTTSSPALSSPRNPQEKARASTEPLPGL